MERMEKVLKLLDDTPISDYVGDISPTKIVEGLFEEAHELDSDDRIEEDALLYAAGNTIIDLLGVNQLQRERIR